jgi:cytosine/adenosine deaminase-related metal-dependent hydrolase
LLSLMRHRGTKEQLTAAVAAGAAEAIASGTTALADISHDNRAWQVLAPLPLRKLCLAEVLGLGPLASGAMSRLQESLANIPSPPEQQALRLEFGISPHAPYTTSEALYRQAIELARDRGWRVCTHLAETRGERQFLATGGGRFLQFLKQIGLIDSSFVPLSCKPIQFAQRVGLLEIPSILAHVNYLDDDELDLLAAGRASVVYCPLSGAFFGRRGHRYAQMLQRGINVALGTDSLASNDRLDMLAEMRSLRADGLLDNHTILGMGTLNGAIALGWDQRIGTLEAGKRADWIAVELPPNSQTADPLETILTSDCKVARTVIDGETVR